MATATPSATCVLGDRQPPADHPRAAADHDGNHGQEAGAIILLLLKIVGRLLCSCDLTGNLRIDPVGLKRREQNPFNDPTAYLLKFRLGPFAVLRQTSFQGGHVLKEREDVKRMGRFDAEGRKSGSCETLAASDALSCGASDSSGKASSPGHARQAGICVQIPRA